jgi:hypothetical protein
MHDWTLLSILFEWKAGRVTLEFRTDRATPAKVVAHEVSELEVPRRHEWGPSVSVNEVRWPSEKHGGGVS